MYKSENRSESFFISNDSIVRILLYSSRTCPVPFIGDPLADRPPRMAVFFSLSLFFFVCFFLFFFFSFRSTFCYFTRILSITLPDAKGSWVNVKTLRITSLYYINIIITVEVMIQTRSSSDGIILNRIVSCSVLLTLSITRGRCCSYVTLDDFAQARTVINVNYCCTRGFKKSEHLGTV